MSNFNSKSFSIGGDDILGSRILDNLDKELSLKDAIIDLYLNVKIRNSDDVSALKHSLLAWWMLTNLILNLDRLIQRR